MPGVVIKALIFDFGRVISAWKPPELFRAYERDLGLAPDTINAIMFDSPHWHRALVGELSMDQYWQAVGPALNLRTAAEIENFQKRYYEAERINEAVRELLHVYHGRLMLALLSNHPPGLRGWLVEWEIDSLFDVIICSAEVGRAKPDPRIYRLTLERLGVRAAEAIFIDDTAGHVAAARAVGMHGLVFTGAAELETDISSLLDTYGQIATISYRARVDDGVGAVKT